MWKLTAHALAAGTIVVAFAGAAAAAGQVGMATARGTVTDEQGGVLPGVTVTVRHPETNTARTITTNDQGHFLVPNLPPGLYEVTAEIQGFGPGKRQVQLRVGQEGTIDFSLHVDRKSTRLNSSHIQKSRMPSSA